MTEDREILTEALNSLGNELYGSQWPVVLAHNNKRLTNSEQSDIGDIDDSQIRTLIVGMRKLKAMRRD